MMENERVVFITGVSGFLGKVLCRVFIDNGWFVVGYDISDPANNSANFVYVQGSVAEEQKIIDALQKYQPKVLIHCAGLLKAKSAAELFDVNVYGTYSLCRSVMLSGVELNFKLISSSAVYGNTDDLTYESSLIRPATEYGMTKKIQEEILLHFSTIAPFEFVIYRPFNLIGPGMPNGLAISSFAKRLIDGKSTKAVSIKVGNLDAIRDYVDVRDAANMIFKSTIGNIKSGDIINICSGNGYRIKDVVNIICDKINYYPEFIEDDSLFRSNDIPYQVGSSILMDGLYEHQLIYSVKESVDCLIEGLKY